MLFQVMSALEAMDQSEEENTKRQRERKSQGNVKIAEANRPCCHKLKQKYKIRKRNPPR